MKLASFTSLFIAPAQAHQTETAADIGATFHVEPNDIPRAGQPTLTWFALTRRGGEAVSLEACDCTLTIYDLAAEEPAEAIATPTLAPVDAEGYQDIPGADVNFPAVGAYELVLQGQPTEEGDFQPFEFRFEVTVASGTVASGAEANSAASSEETQAEAATEPEAESQTGAIATSDVPSQPAPGRAPAGGAIAIGVGVVVFLTGLVVWWRRRKTQQPQ